MPSCGTWSCSSGAKDSAARLPGSLHRLLVRPALLPKRLPGAADLEEGSAVARMVFVIDTVAWVHLEDRRILCARPRGKDVFYVPGGKREGSESDELAWFGYADRPRVPPVDQLLFDNLNATGRLR